MGLVGYVKHLWKIIWQCWTGKVTILLDWGQRSMLNWSRNNYFKLDIPRPQRCIDKVSKKAKIKNLYNQVPHPTQDTTWGKRQKRKKKKHSRKPRGQPATPPPPAGDHKAATNRQERMTTRNTNNKNDPQKKNALERPVNTSTWVLKPALWYQSHPYFRFKL